MEAARQRATLAVTSIATALVLVVFTVPLTTLTSTAQALGAGPGAQAWILGAMSVGAAAGLLVSGVIGDDYGRRLTFLTGTLLLVLASVAGALAPSVFLLIIARVVQGLGGAAILACGLGLIGQAYPGRALARATGVWGAALGAGRCRRAHTRFLASRSRRLGAALLVLRRGGGTARRCRTRASYGIARSQSTPHRCRGYAVVGIRYGRSSSPTRALLPVQLDCYQGGIVRCWFRSDSPSWARPRYSLPASALTTFNHGRSACCPPTARCSSMAKAAWQGKHVGQP